MSSAWGELRQAGRVCWLSRSVQLVGTIKTLEGEFGRLRGPPSGTHPSGHVCHPPAPHPHSPTTQLANAMNGNDAHIASKCNPKSHCVLSAVSA